MQYSVIDTISISSNIFMELAIRNMELFTIVYKRTGEPNLFTAVIDVSGDYREQVIREFTTRQAQ